MKQALLVTGIRTEQCCETTTRHASDLGFAVRYVTDATLTFPMRTRSGRDVSAAEIRERTELVLEALRPHRVERGRVRLTAPALAPVPRRQWALSLVSRKRTSAMS